MEKTKKFVNYVKTHITGFLFVVLLIVVPLGIVLTYLKIITKVTDIIAYYGFCFTIFSILYAAIQFRSNHDWNRRQLAITAAKQVKDKMDKHLLFLNKKFNYLHRKPSDSLDVDLIHKAIYVIENGKLKMNNNEKRYIVDYEGDGHNVKRSIYNVLNSFEYIAAGVYQGVFDKRIIKSLFQGMIIKAYSVFKDYIEHMNNEMHPYKNGKIWVNMKNLAEEFIEEEKKQEARPEKRRKTG